MKNLLPGLRNPPRNVGQELAEGWHYIISSPAIRWILLMLTLVSVIGMPFTVLLPIVADKVLGGGPHTLGFLTAATGVGALTAAMALAMRRSVRGLVKWLGIAAAILGGSLILFGLSHSLWWSLALMYGAGYGMMQQIVTSNTILQTIVADDKRGRVMSFYAMSVFGFSPIGSLIAGSLASWMGAPQTLILGGVLCLCASIWYFGRLREIRRAIRPVYIEMGIVPDPSVITSEQQ